jgi:hypothetical protein
MTQKSQNIPLNHLIKLFPNIELQTFEKVKYIHNSTLSFFIPKGPKMFAWFTYLDNSPICIFLTYENNEIQTIQHHYVAFKEELSLGTILYGTMIDKQFICENIYYANGKQIRNDYLDRLTIIKSVLNLIHCSNYLGSISFFLPKIAKGRLLLEASNMPYTIYGILHLYAQPKYYVLSQNIFHFMVKKRLDLEDVYELFALDGENEYVFHSTALINDFKTSHYMKKVFYKRKRNYKNIEFSDSEEEEENTGDFFVGCIFIQDFKKWKPYVFKASRADNIKQIQNFEKKIFG